MTEDLDLQKCVNNLCAVSLFQDLNDTQLREVARLCEILWLSKGDYVMREGTDPRNVYILLKGEVSVSKRLALPNLERFEAEERILTILKADGHPALGEAALVGSKTRNATVRCVCPSVLYRLDAAKLLELTKRDPGSGCHVFRRLAEALYGRLEGADHDVVKLTAALIYSLEEKPAG